MKCLCYLTLLCAFLNSCKKDDTTDPPSYIKATINGTSWETTNVETVAASQKISAFVGDHGNTEIALWLFDTIPTHYNFREQSISSVNLLKFDAGKTESDLWLSWQTAQETNNKFFIIEKSETVGAVTPTNWSPVDTVLSTGPGNHDYEYLYKITGWFYTHMNFRLKMVDSSNLLQISNVRTIPTGGAFYKAAGQEFRRGYNGTMTITAIEGAYMTGTFSFTVKSLSGELIKVENGQFRCKYKNL